MSGLFYITGYGSGSEDSLDDIELEKKPASDLQNKSKLPVPDLSGVASVNTLEEHQDDPQEHGGRIRAFPHVRGNWATFIYVQYSELENLCKFVSKLKSQLQSIADSCERIGDFHISLSKTFVLKYHLIKSFTNSLQEAVTGSDSFELGFNALKVYCNEDRTRTFVALEVDHYSTKHLIKLTNKVDEALKEYRLPTFYEDPSFHMSILWMNGDKEEQVSKSLEQVNNHFYQETENGIKTIIVNKVNCKVGNKQFQYYLN